MYAEQLLPHDLEAEEAVLGSLIIDGEAVTRIINLVSPEAFYREIHQVCFKACLDLFNRGEVIDQVTLANQLTRTSELELVGGMSYLSHLVSMTPTSAHAEYYASAITDAFLKRQLIGVALRDQSIDFPPEGLLAGEPLLQAGAGQDAELDLRHVQPTSMLGGIVELQPPGNPPGFLSRESLVQRCPAAKTCSNVCSRKRKGRWLAARANRSRESW